MSSGYIKLFRQIQANKLWLRERFTFGQAWVDLLLSANHRDGCFAVRGVTVEVKRGQCGCSIQTLADRWKWSRGKVERFLRLLKTEQQIDYQKSNVTTLITLLNYDIYQTDEHQNGQQTNSRRTADGQQTDTNKNVKNVKNVKKKESAAALIKNYPYPDWLDRELWAEFVEMRARCRYPVNTTVGIKRLINTLKKLIDQGYAQQDIIENSLAYDYRGFFPPADQAGERIRGLSVAEQQKREQLFAKLKRLDEQDEQDRKRASAERP